MQYFWLKAVGMLRQNQMSLSNEQKLNLVYWEYQVFGKIPQMKCFFFFGICV